MGFNSGFKGLNNSEWNSFLREQAGVTRCYFVSIALYTSCNFQWVTFKFKSL